MSVVTAAPQEKVTTSVAKPKASKVAPEIEAVLAKVSNAKGVELRVRRGVVEARDRFIDEWLPATEEHWFVFRATGGLHLHARSRKADKSYREQIRTQAAAGEREIKPRAAEQVPADVLKKVYSYVLANWAVGRGDVATGTELDPAVVSKALAAMTPALIAAEHVNGDRVLTFQPYHDVANDPGAKRAGTADFAKWLKSYEAAKAEPKTGDDPATPESAPQA